MEDEGEEIMVVWADGQPSSASGNPSACVARITAMGRIGRYRKGSRRGFNSSESIPFGIIRCSFDLTFMTMWLLREN
jgi:hypothetical protein